MPMHHVLEGKPFVYHEHDRLAWKVSSFLRQYNCNPVELDHGVPAPERSYALVSLPALPEWPDDKPAPQVLILPKKGYEPALCKAEWAKSAETQVLLVGTAGAADGKDLAEQIYNLLCVWHTVDEIESMR